MLMHKTLVLPRLPLDGTQKEDSVFVDGTDGFTGRFSEVYDFDRFKSTLMGLNVPVWEKEDVPRAKFYDAKCNGLDLFACMELINSELQNSDVPINFGCTFPSSLIGSDLVLQNERVMKLVFQNLVPASKYSNMVKKLISSIRTNGKQEKYNLVHLRAEQDWVEHCKTWEHIPDGIIRDNCMNNTESLGQQLIIKGVDPSLPLYIAIQASKAEPRLLQRVIQNLKFHGYTNTLMKNAIIQDEDIISLPREVAALVDFFVAMKSDRFIGNSVSSFSALIQLERQFQGKWTSYYNGGNIPMATFLPLYKVPWILYTKCESVELFMQQMFVGIESGILYGNVDLYVYCIGMVDRKVTDIIALMNAKFIPRSRIAKLFRDPDSITDITSLSALAMLEEFKQYNYVILSGAKLLIRKQVTLDDFFLPLPTDFALYYQADGSFTGIMIVNTGFIHRGFSLKGIDFIESLRTQGYGQIRRDDMLLQPIQYANNEGNPSIILFNQVSIADLEVYLQTGVCASLQNQVCDQIFQNGCAMLMEFFILSSLPDNYQQILMFCNRKLHLPKH
eukprot:TRINITY_DN5873_c0_g2_i1.p1 TRINITY_DN5873_c0_g2~~TRINITY_DN5873_c0_g2_i1.p1  ORF type:complete len:655 (+),score=52.51 TRINITY_DN5873_c0_g2_i1:287-1966(+)